MKSKKYIKTKNCEVESNYIMENGILIGCHHGMKEKELKYICNKIDQFILSKTN